MALFDRFKKNINMNEIEEEFARCRTIEEKDRLIKKVNEKLSKADEEQTKRLNAILNELNNQVEQAKHNFINGSIQIEEDAHKFGKRVDGLWNSDGLNKSHEYAQRAASSIISDGKSLEREKFDQKYSKISAIFSETSRKFAGYDENKVSFEDKYQTLFKLGVFKTIPKEYIEYAYLVEANKAGVLNANEQALLTKIQSDSNFKDKLSDLYEFSVTAYAALERYDFENEKLFPEYSLSNDVLKTICGDINRSINNYIKDPDIYEQIIVEKEEQDEVQKQMKDYDNFVFNSINDPYVDIDEESKKRVEAVVLNPHFGKNLTDGERQILNKWNNLDLKDSLSLEEKEEIYPMLDRIKSKLTEDEIRFEAMFNPMFFNEIDNYISSKKISQLTEEKGSFTN